MSDTPITATIAKAAATAGVALSIAASCAPRFSDPNESISTKGTDLISQLRHADETIVSQRSLLNDSISLPLWPDAGWYAAIPNHDFVIDSNELQNFNGDFYTDAIYIGTISNPKETEVFRGVISQFFNRGNHLGAITWSYGGAYQLRIAHVDFDESGNRTGITFENPIDINYEDFKNFRGFPKLSQDGRTVVSRYEQENNNDEHILMISAQGQRDIAEGLDIMGVLPPDADDFFGDLFFFVGINQSSDAILYVANLENTSELIEIPEGSSYSRKDDLFFIGDGHNQKTYRLAQTIDGNFFLAETEEA